MKSVSLRYYVYQFSDKTDNFEYLAPNLILGSKFQKSRCGFGISILEILCAPIFKQNEQLWIFGPKFAQKLMLGLEFQKSNSGFRINTSTISCVSIVSQNGQHLVFRPKFGEIAQLCAIFWFKYCWGCCRELGGGGWRWMHSLVIPFDDIFKNLSLVVSYTPVMLHSQWHYWSSSLHKGYPWYKVPSHTISRSWDTSWGGGRGFIPPYMLIPISDIYPCITPVHKLFAQLCCCLGLQLHWR